ncbi:MAG: radical SAM family heme chaperone HemW [Ruminococcaceae bacterium]|nr:radical SAM family heme chaperone HemW [Oscillospiraceae bacterium]
MNSGIYVHIPFCVRKCSYCDFYSVGCASVTDMQGYTDAVIRHMDMSQSKDLFCDSLYFGGGTPSLLPTECVGEIIKSAKKCFSVSDNCEITMECNPCTIDKKGFAELLRHGVNRVSIGVQSLHDSELNALGRLHDANGAVNAIENALEAGFANISCDVMFGIPRQTRESLRQTLEKLCALKISHISAYGLKIENGTPFSQMSLDLPDEDSEREMYFDIINVLKSHGFEQYEISNFARDGKNSRHNIKYWQGDGYISFGPSASSYVSGQRYTYTRSVKDYIEAVTNGKNPPESERYSVDEEEKRSERIIFSLRMNEGISLSECGLSAEKITSNPVLSRLIDEDCMILSDDRLRLTSKGFYISNGIINEILALLD